MEDNSHVNARKSEFQVTKYDGSKVKWTAFIDDIKAAIQAHPSSRDKGLKYLFTDWGADEDNPGEYLIDQRYTTIEEPDHLEFDEDATAKQRLARNKQIEAIRAINYVILKMKAKIMEIIQDRVTQSMISHFNTLESDPYKAYKWLCNTHGPESQGVCAKTNSVDIAIDLVMDKDVRFSTFYSTFVRHIELIGANDIIALALLWTNREHNEGKRQMLPDRLMSSVEHCRQNKYGYAESVDHILGIDNDYHERHCATCVKPAAARGIQAKINNKGDSSNILCYNCNEMGHLAGDCPINICGFCTKKGHRSDVCRDRLAGKPKKKKQHANKKHKEDKEEEVDPPTPPQHTKKAANKKRPRDQDNAKVNKVKNKVHFSSDEEDDSSEEDSDEESPPARRRKVRSAHRSDLSRHDRRQQDEREPWYRELRCVRVTTSRKRQTLRISNRDKKFRGIIDSGADESCTPYADLLISVDKVYDKKNKNKDIILTSASGHSLAISQKGSISPLLSNVLVSEDLDSTLLSTRKISEKGVGTWIPPHSEHHNIGAVLIRTDGMIMGVADKNMSIDIREIGEKNIIVSLPNLTGINSKTHMTVNEVSKYTYGIGQMKVSDKVAFIQRTMMCSKKDLLFMASGAILNFPVSAEQIKKYWSDDICWMQGHMKRRKSDHGQFEDLTEQRAIDSEVGVSEKPSEKQSKSPISIEDFRMIEPRNLVKGMEVGTDIFGPYLGAVVVTAVDKSSGFGISQKLKNGKNGLSSAIGEFADYFSSYGHDIKTLCSDSEAAYKTYAMVKDTLRSRKITPQYSAPYQKSYNGLAEAHHNIIRCKGTAMMCCALHLPQQFWVGAWYLAEAVNNMRMSRSPGSTITRYEDFTGKVPDFKKLIFAPYGHPVLYLVPKEARTSGLTEKGRLGVYIGPAENIQGGIRVYSFKSKRVIETDTYELLDAVPQAWRTYPRDLFAPTDADLEAILVDAEADGRVTRGRAAKEKRAIAARKIEDGPENDMNETDSALELDAETIVSEGEAVGGIAQEGAATAEGDVQEGAVLEGAASEGAIETVNLDTIHAHKKSSKKTPERIANIQALTATKTEQGFHTFSFKKGKSVVLGNSTIVGAGIGLFNGAKTKKERSFVTTFQGKRYYNEAEAIASGSDSIFQTPEGNIFIVGDKKKS